MSAPASRPAVAFCGIVLGLTAAGKIYALAHGSGLLGAPHPFLPGTYGPYVWLGLLVELVAFATLLGFGARAFLSVCLGLAILFIGYHTVDVALGLGGTCPCLGGFLGRWKPLANSEALISFLSALGLGVASFLGLFPVAQTAPPAVAPQAWAGPAVFAASLWLLLGGAGGLALAGPQRGSARRACQATRGITLTRADARDDSPG